MFAMKRCLRVSLVSGSLGRAWWPWHRVSAEKASRDSCVVHLRILGAFGESGLKAPRVWDMWTSGIASPVKTVA